jgi:hypothetical protein
MGVGRGKIEVAENGQRRVETCINEHGQRWLYRAWTEWMTADNWAELKARTPAAEGVV